MARTRDVMGYKLQPVFDLFTKEEIRAAKRLSKARGYQWDTVGTDPRVYGWRFLRDAKIVLAGKDLGESCPVKGSPHDPLSYPSRLGSGTGRDSD